MIALTNPPAPFTAFWRSTVANMIREGYGVEDIGLRLACRADTVRREVRQLRAAGRLDQWFRQ